MGKRNLTDWAAVSEIFGNAAVIVSLLILAYSVAQNTKVVRAQIDNDWYQVHHEYTSDHINDTSLLALRLKARKAEALSELDEARMWYVRFRDLIMWEQAFTRFHEGLFNDAQWQRTDRAYSMDMTIEYPEERWAEIKPYMRSDFAEHVDAAFDRARN